jgi:hypothetical protein
LINISDKDEIASVAKIDVIEGEEDEVIGEDGIVMEGTIETSGEIVMGNSELNSEDETPPTE